MDGPSTTEGEPASGAPDVHDAVAEEGAVVGDASRRRFVIGALATIGAIAAAALAIPVAAFAGAPAWLSRGPLRVIANTVPPTLRSSAWTPAGALAELEIGVPKYVVLDRPIVDGWVREKAPIGAYVVRQSDTEADVFDSHCTHLGCPLAWSGGSGRFVCPCHGGAFDAAGDPVAGPPPRPLDRYETRINDGQVECGILLDA